MTDNDKAAVLGPSDRNAWQVSDARADLVRAIRPSRPVSLEAEPKHCAIDLARTAMIVVDMQNDFCHPRRLARFDRPLPKDSAVGVYYGRGQPWRRHAAKARCGSTRSDGAIIIAAISLVVAVCAGTGFRI